ncbi:MULTISPECIES: PAS domain-containing protein [unclassified Pseudomonas]|uniref:hybrid sensor histidine kinase/response regulator n=1 Tax=unclassified Pseudomonas TaxID=196821 RepID=UPI002449DD75|nr:MULTISPECIES: PAS domain-containing protein [unclassified Pseudomonas]MDH0303382.1 PAS domain-containing protein [Pseudomonas sp. GD04091]MDH1984551.1 PAS domain-containing protein [Pseudomonas sp. GD03689]
MPSRELQSLRQEVEHLRQRNALLEARLSAPEQDDPHLLRCLFDTMDEGFCVIEFFDGPHGPLSDYVHVVANPAYARYAGIPDVVGQTLRQIAPEETSNWLARYGEVLRTGQPLHFEQELVATGRVLLVTTFRIGTAERRQVAVLFTDVTERRRAELALRQLNEQLERRVNATLAERALLAELVEHCVARVQVMDRSLRFLALNARAVKDFEYLFGRRVQAGDSLLECMDGFPEECARSVASWRRALDGESFTEVIEYGRGDATRHFELRFTPLRDTAGEVSGAYLFIYDISHQVEEQQRLLQTEEALRQAQKMEAVGQLTGGIAHDFNNLLAGILGAQKLIRRRLEQGRHAEVPTLLNAACDSAQRAATLVQRLLAFSRRQTLQPRATRLSTLVEGMTELISRSVGPSIEVRAHFAQEQGTAFIDPPQLESALLNLCLNARDAMPGGGRIDISCTTLRLTDEAARAVALPSGTYLRLSVLDCGGGMPPEVVSRACEPFFSTKPPGRNSGLGLSMVYGFIRQSGGQLHIQSAPGVGTSVHLYLPCHDDTPPARQDAWPKAPEPVRKPGGRVLLVEDQPAMRLVITEALEELGHRVESHASGPAALGSAFQFDLLITDIGLPGGLDGHQVARAFRARSPAVPILFITGYDPSVVLSDNPLPAGARILTKPFPLEALIEQVDQLLEAAAPPLQARSHIDAAAPAKPIP